MSDPFVWFAALLLLMVLIGALTPVSDPTAKCQKLHWFRVYLHHVAVENAPPVPAAQRYRHLGEESMTASGAWRVLSSDPSEARRRATRLEGYGHDAGMVEANPLKYPQF